VLDPGHGGSESGAASATLTEKAETLAIATRTKTRLERAGFRVYLTRTRDQAANTPPRDRNHDGKVDHIDEFNARTLFANRHHADVFVSIHLDGSSDPSKHGTHGYYCPDRPFWRQSKQLAALLTGNIAIALQRSGYASPNNGIETDVADIVPQSRPDYPWFLVLGPSRHRWITGSAMPGALIETLYLSSPRDVAALQRHSTLDAIAAGYARGIQLFLNAQARR
jgi:N-acetylmuramoyl-L-alanine amidase